IEFSRDLHIEHILPQEWDSSNLNWSSYFTDEQANKALNSLGNLTLLKGSKNIQASNSNFLDKKDVYKGKFDNKVSSFELTRKLADFDEWTDDKVKSRQKEMIQIIQSKLDIN
ncbi:TPA: HNH endonuclease family protein, partial [Mannheimia haemolytica]